MASASVAPVEADSAKRREYAYLREWYAGVIARAMAGGLDNATVASSYAATFRPLAMPAVGGAYRLPDGSVENRKWTVLPLAEDYADRDYRAMFTWAMDAGGGFLRTRDGRIVRDRREVARLLRDTPDFQRFVLSTLREPAPGGRKRRLPWTIARSLLFADLRPAFGTRPAARLLLTWEDELGAPWRILDGAAGLVARAVAGELRTDERHTLRCAEQTMRRACLPRERAPRRS